jgi:ribosomal protein S18 acetylase RimI-like enzyme
MNDTRLTITPAVPDDAVLLSAFSIETFYDTYQAHNTPEDMQEYADKYFNIRQLTEELNTPGTRFFIAKEANNIVGYIKLRDHKNPESIRDSRPIELERIYVHSSQKGKGIGRTLLDKACDFARQHAYEVLWLGVWEKNTKAIRFYEQYGFTNFGKQLFVLGKDVQQDLQYMIAL